MHAAAVTRLFLKSVLTFVCTTACLILYCLLTAQAALAQGDPPQAPGAALPVTINFDTLPTGTVVSNQYPQVTFSAPTGYYGDTLYVAQHNIASGVSYPKGLVSLFTNCSPGSECAQGDVYLDFPIPVNNFSFSILGSSAYYASYHPLCQVDVYVNNGSWYGTYPIYGHGQPTVPVNVTALKSIPNITNIRIRDVSNTDYYGYIRRIYYDDFTFTPNLNVQITNYRIKNSEQALLILNGTTQNALLAGEVIFETYLAPSTFTGGTYSWNVTGPYTVTGGTNQSSIHIRWKETGTYTATVTYTRSGFTTTGAISVKVIVPTLNSFTANADPEQINRDLGCSRITSQGSKYVTSTLGCYQDSSNLRGIVFQAQAQVPTLTYLTEPGEAGIKIRQYIYDFRKVVNDLENGNFQCKAYRTPQGELAPAWQKDGGEEVSEFLGFPPRFFQGNTISRTSVDGPGSALEIRSASDGKLTLMFDVAFADEYFETYVDYFVGNDHTNPLFTQQLKLATEQNYRYSKIAWRRNVQSIFDPSVPYLKYRLQFTNSNEGAVQPTGTNSLPPFEGHGFSQSNVYGPCPGDPTPSTNKIDGARCFIKQQYVDFFNRVPDIGGWDFWTYQITKCAFDRNCIYSQRYLVAREFFLSAELIQGDPAMANPPGSPNFNPSVYNPAFVRHCYEGFLRRTPDQGGIDFWVDILNRTGDYNGVINAFITSSEYRGRIFACQELY